MKKLTMATGGDGKQRPPSEEPPPDEPESAPVPGEPTTFAPGK